MGSSQIARQNKGKAVTLWDIVLQYKSEFETHNIKRKSIGGGKA